MFTQIEDGVHDAEIIDVSLCKDDDGKQFILCELEIKGGPNDGDTVFRRYYGKTEQDSRWLEEGDLLDISFSDAEFLLAACWRAADEFLLRIKTTTIHKNGREWQDLYFVEWVPRVTLPSRQVDNRNSNYEDPNEEYNLDIDFF